ncbi:Hypothetical predicted protein [Marmota monax]|uniref:Mitochondrial carrier homolog 1 n=1 Tax=Marmota monax TaxID=9995 RepID=A0A5E4BAZ6_MARMO|nr:hypothetical protein GHT09_000699 [Marmota monax]VTJ66536.1 Hypothetical predicted protein [Marmota monax]
MPGTAGCLGGGYGLATLVWLGSCLHFSSSSRVRRRMEGVFCVGFQAQAQGQASLGVWTGVRLLVHSAMDAVGPEMEAAYAVWFSQALAIRSYTKFVMGIAVSMLTYPFLLVGDLMAVNNCGLQAGLPPYSPVFKSWIHCWKYLSVQGQLFRGSSLLFRRVSSGSCFALE